MLMRDGLPADVTVGSLRERGAVGDLLGTVLDAAGRPIDHPINDRVIGIGLDDLRRIPNVILAAGGAHKAPIIRAALRIGVVGTLVTDEATAALALGDDP
jgi:DNA-binding transcriptional regulator LsrR (DeoR family)